MFSKPILALGSLALATLAIHPPALLGDQSRLKGQGLNNCDIDVRPRSSGEAQVYWADAGNGKHGIEYDIWDTQSDALLVGNADATTEIQVKTGGKNTVSFNYNTATGKVELVIVNVDGDRIEQLKLDPVGEYDPLGPLVEPTTEIVRRNAENKRRIRFSATNYGLTFEFTLSDA